MFLVRVLLFYTIRMSQKLQVPDKNKKKKKLYCVFICKYIIQYVEESWDELEEKDSLEDIWVGLDIGRFRSENINPHKPMVGNCFRSAKRILGPIQSKAQTPRLATLLATYPFSAKGCTEPQRLSARSHNYFSSGYTFHDSVTVRPKCVITTAL